MAAIGPKIKELRLGRQMTQHALADELRISVQAVSQLENDATVPTFARLVDLAKVLGPEVLDPIVSEAGGELTLSSTTTPGMSPVAKVGHVAAGVFREVDDFDQSEPETFWEPIDPQFPKARRMAFDVDPDGDSMNALKPRPILPGDTLVCVAFEDIADRLKVRDGLVVVVQRTRDGGHTREWSVKQVELYEDRIEFHPRSTNAKHKPIVVKRDAAADDGVEVEIIGLVRAVRNDFAL